MSRRTEEFSRPLEVIPIHIERYNKQIQRLLAVSDHSKDDISRGSVSKKEYFRAREERIKSYNDCLNTMFQKERLLQFHNSGFQIEVVDETIQVNIKKSKYDFSNLSVEELSRMNHLLTKAKKNEFELIGITANQSQSNQVTDTVNLDNHIEERANIEDIQHEDPPIEPTIPLLPSQRLKVALDKLAATKFKEAGAKLDTEEEDLIGN